MDILGTKSFINETHGTFKRDHFLNIYWHSLVFEITVEIFILDIYDGIEHNRQISDICLKGKTDG